MPEQNESRARWAWLAVALLLSGCAGDEGEDEASAPRVEPSGVVALAERQAVRDGMITVEGFTEPMRFHLYRAPENFPLPFTTYLPADVQAVQADEGWLRFVPTYTGTPDPEASLTVRALPEGADEGAALAAAGETVDGLGEPVTAEPSAGPWARAAVPFRADDGSAGTLYVVEHAGRFVHIVVTTTPQLAEGFQPRAMHVLDEWRWEDTGEGLRREIRY